MHLTSFHPPDDVRIFLKECRSLADAGFEVHLVAPAAPEETRNGVTMHGFELPGGFRPLRIGRRLWRVWRAARRVDPKICHFHEPELLPVALLLKLGGARTVYDVHEDQLGTLAYAPYKLGKGIGIRLLEGLARRVCDGFVAATPAIAARFPPERTIELPNYPLREEFVEQPSDTTAECNVAYVGGLTPVRGLREMIEAISRVRHTDARLVAMGSFGSSELELEARSLPGWSRVDYLGRVNRREVAERLGAARAGLVLFHPEPNHTEALPNKLFEYMAAGLPVVASDFPSWRSLLDPIGCAVYVDPLDPDSIAGAIDELLAGEERAKEMGRRGATAVRERLNWQHEAPKLIGLYSRLAPQDRAVCLTICALGTGTSTHVANRLRWFARRGHRVFLLTMAPNPAGIEGVVQMRLDDDSLPLWRRLRSSLPQPLRGALHQALYAIAFVRALRRCRPDVVHVYHASNYHGWLAGILGTRPLAVNVMGSDVSAFVTHSAPETAREWLILRLLHAADFITPQSNLLVDAINRLGDLHTKNERIMWGVSLDEFRRRDASELRRRLGLAPDARVILSPKILQPFYRIHLLVEAMPRVLEECPDAVLLLTEYNADPSYREQIIRRIEELDLGQRVRLVGVIDHADMPAYYSLAEISIAIPPRDALPHALFESLACGTPQILSRLPQYLELVQHEESAYFVDPDQSSIAAGIVRLLDDAPHRAGIAERGRQIVEEQANFDEQAARVETRLRELATTIPPRAIRFTTLVPAGFAAARAYWRFRRPAPGSEQSGIPSVDEF